MKGIVLHMKNMFASSTTMLLTWRVSRGDDKNTTVLRMCPPCKQGVKHVSKMPSTTYATQLTSTLTLQVFLG
jgi:hypothetical protein